MRRRVFLVALAMLFLLPTVAHAGVVTFDPWQASLRAAALQWGGMPPCGTPTFAHHESGLDEFGQDFDMEVHIDLSAPSTWASADCVIHVSENAEGLTPGDKCAEVVHEVGHLWGRGHVDRYGNIMFFGGLRFSWSWACQRVMRATPYATRCARARSMPGYREVDCVQVARWTLRPPYASGQEHPSDV